MKWFVLVVSLVFVSLNLSAQEEPDIEIIEELDSVSSPKFIFISEYMPEFRGGDQAMLKFIKRNLEYSKEAIANKIEGRVYVSFVVSDVGAPENIKVVRGVHPLLDSAACRVITKFPKWNTKPPRGKYVPVTMTLPINFELPKEAPPQDEE